MSDAVDKLSNVTPGRLPLFEEPANDLLADKSSKDLKKKPVDQLTANDKFVLDMLKKLPVMDLLTKGFIEWPVEICEGVTAVFRTLLTSQMENVTHDVSVFAQQKELVKSDDGMERLSWQPNGEEIKTYHIKRVLAEATVRVGDKVLGGSLDSRMAFFSNQELFLTNALYRRMQNFFTAVSLLFPSDNQKELLNELKKA